MLEAQRYAAAVDRFEALDPVVIASCHSPLLDGKHVARAFELLRDVPTAPRSEMPGQPVLDQIVAMAAAA
jgi:hypothetical protein